MDTGLDTVKTASKIVVNEAEEYVLKVLMMLTKLKASFQE